MATAKRFRMLAITPQEAKDRLEKLYPTVIFTCSDEHLFYKTTNSHIFGMQLDAKILALGAEPA